MTWAYQTHQTNVRGSYPLRHSSMLFYLRRRLTITDGRLLGTHRCMGSPRLVSSSAGCDHALSGTTTTINRMDKRGQHHSVDKISHVLLCSVSSQYERVIFDADFLYVLVVLFFFACTSAISFQVCRYADLWPSHLHPAIHHFDRAHILRDRRFTRAFSKSRSRRYSCWDHASFLAFEDIMPSVVWLTLIQRLLWWQSFSKIKYVIQLAVACSTGKAGT